MLPVSIATGCVIIIGTSNVQRFKSLTVTVYDPAESVPNVPETWYAPDSSLYS